MASTPNKSGSLFQKIEDDANSKYAKLKLDYRYGLGTIYDMKFIENKKLEPEFDREYNLKYKDEKCTLIQNQFTHQAPIKVFKRNFIAILVKIHNIGWIVEL